MRTQPVARLAVLVCLAAVVAGCSAASGADHAGGSGAPPLQLRLVTSSEDGPCDAPHLTTEDTGTACDVAGTSTYELAGSLGVVTPTSVARGDQPGAQTVVVDFDEADARTLGEVTRDAVGQELALVLDGSVLSAATVGEPVDSGAFTFGFATAAEADKFAALLGAPVSP